MPFGHASLWLGYPPLLRDVISTRPPNEAGMSEFLMANLERGDNNLTLSTLNDTALRAEDLSTGTAHAGRHDRPID